LDEDETSETGAEYKSEEGHDQADSAPEQDSDAVSHAW
jgi:hypothetical protein